MPLIDLLILFTGAAVVAFLWFARSVPACAVVAVAARVGAEFGTPAIKGQAAERKVG